DLPPQQLPSPGATVIKYFAIGLIGGLLVLRLLRSRWGARLLGVPERVLDIVYLVALVLTGVIAVVTEYWLLLVVVAVLLVLRGIEALRARQSRRGMPTTSAAWPMCWAASSRRLTRRTPRVTGGSHCSSSTSSRSSSVSVPR